LDDLEEEKDFEVEEKEIVLHDEDNPKKISTENQKSTIKINSKLKKNYIIFMEIYQKKKQKKKFRMKKKIKIK